jgi:electron transfer flavoprotein beta subunit
MKILVPIKRVSDPDNANKVKITPDGKGVSTEGLSWDVNPFDIYAVEAAIRLTENAPKKERLGEVVVMTLGPKDTTIQLRRCLAMGAERAILVEAQDEDLDGWVVARAIAKVYEEEKPDLVLLGKQEVDGESNQTTQILSHMLGLPQATFAATMKTQPDAGWVEVQREVDGGISRAKITLPAVVSVDLRIIGAHAVQNGVTPSDHEYPSENVRYTPLPMINKAKKKPLDEKSPGDLGVDTETRVEYLGFSPPPERKAGITVETVEELMDKLKNEARVL